MPIYLKCGRREPETVQDVGSLVLRAAVESLVVLPESLALRCGLFAAEAGGDMAKLDLNTFITAHPNCVCVNFWFSGYGQLKKQAARAKRPVPSTTGGKEIPTPHKVITATLRRMVIKGDYAVKSFDGDKIRVMLADDEDVRNFKVAFHLVFERCVDPPCTVRAVRVFDLDPHLTLAKSLGLM